MYVSLGLSTYQQGRMDSGARAALRVDSNCSSTHYPWHVLIPGML